MNQAKIIAIVAVAAASAVQVESADTQANFVFTPPTIEQRLGWCNQWTMDDYWKKFHLDANLKAAPTSGSAHSCAMLQWKTAYPAFLKHNFEKCKAAAEKNTHDRTIEQFNPFDVAL